MPPSTRRQPVNLSMHHVSNHCALLFRPFLVAIVNINIKVCSLPPHAPPRKTTRRHTDMDVTSLLPSLSRAPFNFLLSCRLAPSRRAIQRSGKPSAIFSCSPYSCRLRLPNHRRHPSGSRSRALFPLSLLPLGTSNSCPVLPFFLIACGPGQGTRKSQ